MIYRIKQLFLGTHTDFFELFNALLLMLWGAWFFLPYDTFAQSKSFVVLHNIMSDQVFGLIPFLIGSYILYTLIALRIKRRRWGVLMGSAFWIFVAILMGVANVQGTGVPIYSCIAIFSALSYLRQ